MGRKRKKGSNNKGKKKSSLNIDLAVICLFVISVLLFVLIYAEKGAIGEILSPALGGIIGFIKYEDIPVIKSVIINVIINFVFFIVISPSYIVFFYYI